MGAEDTFPYDRTTLAEMETELDKIALIVYDRLLKYNLKGRTLTLKVKYGDFKQITRNQSFTTAFNDLETICKTAKQLMAATNPDDVKVRLLGISLSNFGDLAPKQKEEKEAGPGDQLSITF